MLHFLEKAHARIWSDLQFFDKPCVKILGSLFERPYWFNDKKIHLGMKSEIQESFER